MAPWPGFEPGSGGRQPPILDRAILPGLSIKSNRLKFLYLSVTSYFVNLVLKIYGFWRCKLISFIWRLSIKINLVKVDYSMDIFTFWGEPKWRV